VRRRRKDDDGRAKTGQNGGMTSNGAKLAEVSLGVKALSTLCCAVALIAPSSAAARARADAVERALGVYLIRPERREADERVRWPSPSEAEVWFQRDVTPETRDSAVCDAVRWLLLGRLSASHGVFPLFDEDAALERVTMVLFAIGTSVAPNQAGAYEQRRAVRPVGRVSITRDTAAALDRDQLKGALAGPECARRGATLVDEVDVP
jgi:hypothetical protein